MAENAVTAVLRYAHDMKLQALGLYTKNNLTDENIFHPAHQIIFTWKNIIHAICIFVPWKRNSVEDYLIL